LKGNKTISKVKAFIEQLGRNSGYFSFVLYERDNKKYFLKKDEKFPFISFDWTVYIMIRTYAKTIITSGLTLRSEKHVFQEDRGTFGKKILK
jgi:hypothetical protein